MTSYLTILFFMSCFHFIIGRSQICGFDPSITASTYPPVLKVVSNATYLYALQASIGFSIIYGNSSLCDNLLFNINRFNQSGFLTNELEGIFCGDTCAYAKDITAALQEINTYNMNIFATQLEYAMNSHQEIWVVLCQEMDPEALVVIFENVNIQKGACYRANQTLPESLPRTLPHPSGFSFDKMRSLRSSLAGGEARASFTTAALLQNACSRLWASTSNLLKISLSPFHFQKGLCGNMVGHFPIATSEDIHNDIAEHFGELFVQILWMAGSSPKYRNLICLGYDNSTKDLINLNASGIQSVGLRKDNINVWMAARCTAARV